MAKEYKIDIQIQDNISQVKGLLVDAIDRALEDIGKQAEGYAKDNITKAGRVDTGTMRNSVTHEVHGDTVYVGTNIEYAIYNELGTGIHASDGKGRKDPWVYKDEKGVFHKTHGIKPIHFLRDAVIPHQDEYKRMVEDKLRGK